MTDPRPANTTATKSAPPATARVAVIGCGYWGRNLVRVFESLGALAVVCETDPMAVEVARGLSPKVRIEPNYAAVLADPEVHAVVIATPAETHAVLAAQALASGKHVFVEKPLALDFAEGAALVKQAEAAGLVLMVGHILEFHPGIVELVRRVRNGDLGQIQYIYSNRLNLGKVRQEENILWSFAPHDIAVMLRIVGAMPLELTATGGAWLQPNIADVTVTNLLFDKGVRGHIFVSWLHPYKEQKLVVVGSKRMAVFDDVAKVDKLVLYDQGIDWVAGRPTPRKNDGEVIRFDAAEPLRVEALHFLESIAAKRPALTDGRSGLQVLQVLQAAQRSVSLGGKPVQLSTPGEGFSA